MLGTQRSAARSIPHTLRSVELDYETLAELGVLCGFDDDLAGQITATSNRISGLLTQIIPFWKGRWARTWTPGGRGPAPPLSDPAGAEDRRPRTGQSTAEKDAPRAADRLTEAALDQQSVVVVGTGAAGIVLPKLAEQLLALPRQRDEIASQVEALVETHPLYKVLTEVTGKHFASVAHLAFYAGFAPVTRRSGLSIRAGGAIRNSSEHCSSQSLPPCIIHRPEHITTANARRVNPEQAIAKVRQGQKKLNTGHTVVEAMMEHALLHRLLAEKELAIDILNEVVRRKF